MLSKKMAVSLTSLIAILALAFVVSPAIAGEFETTFSYDEAENVDGRAVDVTLKFDQVVDLDAVQAVKIAVTIVESDFSSSKFDITGNSAVSDSGPVVQKDLDSTTTGGQYDGKTFTFTIASSQLLRKGFDADGTTNANQTKSATKIYLSIPSGIASLDPGNADTSKAATLAIDLRTVTTQDRDTPAVVSIQRLRPGSQTVVAAFQEAAVTGPFEVRIVLSEKPADFDKFHEKIDVSGGTKGGFVIGEPFAWVGGMTATDPIQPIQGQAVKPHPIEGRYNHDGADTPALGDGTVNAADDYGPLVGVPDGLDETKVPLPTGPDGMYHQCRITISPHRRADHVTVKIKEFHDGDSPRNYYYPHQVDKKPNGREQLKLKVAIPAFDRKEGVRVYLPSKEDDKTPRIPYVGGKPGHYILTRDKNGSHINFSKPEDENASTKQTRVQMLYNVRASESLPNLETFLANHGTIHLVSYVTTDGTKTGAPKYKKGDAYISEVMWGTDASQDIVSKSNWIEIRNGTTGAITIGQGDNDRWALWFYEAHEEPETEYPSDTIYEGPIGQAGALIDVISSKASDTNLSWSIFDKGQSGRSNIDLARAEQEVLTPTTPLISMYRMMNTDGTLSDGTMASSWEKTGPPSVNLGAGRENAIVATPGAEPFDTADSLKAAADAEAARKKAEEDQKKASARAGSDDIMITEIMVDTDSGRLPQWIELTHVGTGAVSLDDWEMVIDNAIDAEVLGGGNAITVSLSGVKLDVSKHPGNTGKGQSALVVAWGARDVSNNIRAERVINLATQLDKKSRYQLLSYNGFRITLVPPRSGATTSSFGDIAGNLHEDWDIPMDGRSSLIRAGEMGTDADGWTLASKTNLVIGQPSFYGDDEDAGTPGQDSGGPLPVELSHFRPARDKATGAVVITWATQSELNNAGFFIKRAQQRNGEFKVINATMIAGAGTTSEKQFYTYTDTTAQPNIVYYYQIEDVSLDGNRQTLTRGIRLKGHVGAAGKATTLWGELKTSHE